MKKIGLTTQILIGMGIGVLTGIYLPDLALELSFLGTLFIRLLKMIIVPLVFASITVGTFSLGDLNHIKKLGTKTLAVFVMTTAISVTIGISVVNIIQPGNGVQLTTETQAPTISAPPTIGDMMINIVPTNMVSALAEGQMLSIIFFAVLIGCALIAIKEEGKPLYNIIDGLDKVMMSITQWIMKLAPYGVFSLMASVIAKTGIATLKPLAIYIVTVLLSLGIYAIIVIPALLVMVFRYSPLKAFSNMFAALATVFSTASSSATMPITMDLLRRKVGASERVINFAIPLGTTINMDGTALFQSIATIFIAQVYGIELVFSHYVIILITAVLASIGAAAIPSAGVMMLFLIMSAVNVPIEGIGLIFAVDRVLDMFRSTVNVWGNAASTIMLTRLEGEPFQPEE